MVFHSEVSALSLKPQSVKLSLYLRKVSPQLDWKTRFRIIASKASRQNRNPDAYSTMESPIKEGLKRVGFTEGVSFFHEYRINGYLGKNGHQVY